jgi:hypothetical protein
MAAEQRENLEKIVSFITGLGFPLERFSDADRHEDDRGSPESWQYDGGLVIVSVTPYTNSVGQPSIDVEIDVDGHSLSFSQPTANWIAECGQEFALLARG